jgi:hypothetical protein
VAAHRPADNTWLVWVCWGGSPREGKSDLGCIAMSGSSVRSGGVDGLNGGDEDSDRSDKWLPGVIHIFDFNPSR